MNINDFHKKTYHPTEYNCSHFAQEVWQFLEGRDISDLVTAWNHGNLRTRMKSRHGLEEIMIVYGRNLLVLFQKAGEPPHLGVWTENKVFHMTADSGPRLDSLFVVSDQYDSHKFYYA